MKALGDLLSAAGPALAAGVANHLWQSSAAGLAILGLLRATPHLSARTRRGLAWLALAKFALPIAPLFSFLGRGRHAGGRLGSALTSLPAPPAAGTWIMPVPAAFGEAHAMRAGLGLAGCVWVAGFVLLAGLWVARGWRFRRQLLAGAEPPSRQRQDALRAAAQRTGVRRLPRCLSVDAADGPGVLGLFSPVIILPRGLEAALSRKEFDAILVHELVHVRRRDCLWNLLQVLLVGAFWFDPVVWRVHRRLQAEVEKSCDEEVLAITADPDSYATGIIKAVRLSLGLPQVGFARAASPPVTARLHAIFGHAQRSERPARRAAALGAGAALLIFSGYAGSIRPEGNGAPVLDGQGDRMPVLAARFLTHPAPAIGEVRRISFGGIGQKSASSPLPASAPSFAANLPAAAATIAPAHERTADSAAVVAKSNRSRPPAVYPAIPAGGYAAADLESPQLGAPSFAAAPPRLPPAAEPTGRSAHPFAAASQPRLSARRIGLILDANGASVDDQYFPTTTVIPYRHGI